jgi:Raf kinase inhibitor-like YbhB/YbcL family protein
VVGQVHAPIALPAELHVEVPMQSPGPTHFSVLSGLQTLAGGGVECVDVDELQPLDVLTTIASETATTRLHERDVFLSMIMDLLLRAARAYHSARACTDPRAGGPSPMRPSLSFVLCLATLSACPAPAREATSAADAGPLPPIAVTSSAFAQGATIPSAFTCSGADTSPPLEWSGSPPGAKSFVLIVDDPDAPGGTFTHWLLFDLPATTALLARGATAGVAATNGFGKAAYGGPCPPPGAPHHYYFRVYALDVPTLGAAAGASRAQVEAAMSGHQVGYGALMALFGR